MLHFGEPDDMLIIRGVNLFPTQVETVIDQVANLQPYYQLVVSREQTLDEVEVRVEVAEEFMRAIGYREISEQQILENDRFIALQEQLKFMIKDHIGLNMRVSLKAPHTIPRSEGGKLKRVLDLRNSK